MLIEPPKPTEPKPHYSNVLILRQEKFLKILISFSCVYFVLWYNIIGMAHDKVQV